MFFLFCHWLSELRWPIAVKLCHVISICACFIMHVQKLAGPSPKNFVGQAKNMQILGRFYTTSAFDRKYLRNDSSYSKSESHFIENDFSRVRSNKSGELWSIIQKVVSRRPSSRQAVRGLDFQEICSSTCMRAWAAPAG